MKINFEELFSEFKEATDILKLVETNNKLKIFYGISKEGKKRLAFLSNNKPEIMDSTRVICVSYYKDNNEMNWLSFDLENDKFENLFYTFCNDIVSSMFNLNDELEELEFIKNRFNKWKKMFQNVKNVELPEEKEQGLYGELYFLYKYMIPKYGIDKSISAWSGPLKYNKDFTIDNIWYEVKTSSVSASTIKIASLSQLDSDVVGYLSVVKVEKMSPEYDGELASVLELIQVILDIVDSEIIQDDFINKVIEYGIGPENNFGSRKYDMKKIELFTVDDDFPRLTRNSINYSEIEDASYTIILNGIERFKREEL